MENPYANPYLLQDNSKIINQITEIEGEIAEKAEKKEISGKELTKLLNKQLMLGIKLTKSY
jgi:hypothetical protein